MFIKEIVKLGKQEIGLYFLDGPPPLNKNPVLNNVRVLTKKQFIKSRTVVMLKFVQSLHIYTKKDLVYWYDSHQEQSIRQYKEY